jgi:hypothetical protein
LHGKALKMKAPIVRILLDETGSNFECGSVMTGQVEVNVVEECPPRNLIVAVGYRVKTEGGDIFCDIEKKELFSGSWSPGIFCYPFCLTIPEGGSYTGTLFKVEWFLRAGAENTEGNGGFLGEVMGKQTPDGFSSISRDDEKGDIKKINPLPAEVSPLDRERSKASEILRRESAGPVLGCLLPSIAVFFLGVFLAWLGIGHDAELFGVILALLGLFFVGLVIQKKLINRKIVATDFWIGSTVVWPGRPVPCDLTVQARGDLEVIKATLTLEGWEEVPNKRHYIHREEKEIDLPDRTLPVGVPISLNGEFLVPEGSPCTMEYNDEVKFLWEVKLCLKIKGSPDWFDREPITVLHRRGTES